VYIIKTQKKRYRRISSVIKKTEPERNGIQGIDLFTFERDDQQTL